MVRHKGKVGGVFLTESGGSLWVHSMWSDSKQGVLQGSFKALEASSLQEARFVERTGLDVTTW